MERDKLEFIFVGYRPPSTNDAYIPTAGKIKYGNKRRSAFFRRSSWLIEWQSKVTEAISSEVFYSSEDISEFITDVLDNGKGLRLDISVSMPRRSYGVHKLCGVDCSNFIKSIEDAVYENLGIDDKYNVQVTSDKSYNNSGKWIVKAVVTKTESAWVENNIIDKESVIYEFTNT